MTNEPNIESKLERLKGAVSLRADEKGAHRDAVLAFMAKNPLPKRSPYRWLMASGTRYASALMLLVFIGGGGIVSAEASRPGDALYIAKLKVTEPARSALTFDTEEKTAFEIERADKRLKEFAAYSAKQDADPETTALIAASLSESIQEVSEEVDTLTETGDAEGALKANADLQSVLAAHSIVLDTLQEENPESSDEVAAIAASVDAGIAETENAENEITDQLATEPVDPAAVLEQADSVREALQEARAEYEAGAGSFDASDADVIAGDFAQILEILAEADASVAAGSSDDAILLYAEAGQRIQGLRTLVNADRALGIDMISEEN